MNKSNSIITQKKEKVSEKVSPSIAQGVNPSEPVMMALNSKHAISLHSNAGRVYMSLFVQNFTKEELMELVDEKHRHNQTLIERLVLDELADSQSEDKKVSKESRRFILSYLNRGGEMKNLSNSEEKVSEGTLMDDFMNGIIEGIVESEKLSENPPKSQK